VTGPEDDMGYGATPGLEFVVADEIELPLGVFPLGDIVDAAVGHGTAVVFENGK